MTREIDQDAVRELELYIENDSTLYRQQYQPIQKNLTIKKAQGKYDHDKAVKLFMYLVDNGAKKYDKEFGDGGRDWNIVFPKPERLEVAKNLRNLFEREHAEGNYDEYIPKKYKIVAKPKAKKARKSSHESHCSTKSIR